MSRRTSEDYVRREAGILLHLSSLPGSHGIGDLGDAAFRFVDFLESAGQRLWQILPLTPLGLGNSPYASPSAMAGNPLFISLDLLKEEGLLDQSDLATEYGFPSNRVLYDEVSGFKLHRLRRAHARFAAGAAAGARAAFERFCSEESSWLDDFSLFMALKDGYNGASWLDWHQEIVRREPDALRSARERLAAEADYHRFVQFVFANQWKRVRDYAHLHGVRIVGDIPIFVALDSADVWSRQGEFFMDQSGHPTVVAGVPPDYFSATGQRWGNPLYRWPVMAEDGFRWWIERFRRTLDLVDIVRIDHFRGFQAYWEIPAENETAEHGQWVEGPGEKLFRAVESELGHLPVIAENLGIITPEVEALRQALGYPGMVVLHFAFEGGPSNPYLPHNYDKRCVGYTGTHDNDTTLGWFATHSAEEQERVRRYLGSACEVNWDLTRLLYRSVADVAVVPLQDVLGLGTESRMNMPGQRDGNWIWRVEAGQMAPEPAERLRQFVEVYGRAGQERNGE